jgi:hypothetical protein
MSHHLLKSDQKNSSAGRHAVEAMRQVPHGPIKVFAPNTYYVLLLLHWDKPICPFPLLIQYTLNNFLLIHPSRVDHLCCCLEEVNISRVVYFFAAFLHDIVFYQVIGWCQTFTALTCPLCKFSEINARPRSREASVPPPAYPLLIL